MCTNAWHRNLDTYTQYEFQLDCVHLRMPNPCAVADDIRFGRLKIRFNQRLRRLALECPDILHAETQQYQTTGTHPSL